MVLQIHVLTFKKYTKYISTLVITKPYRKYHSGLVNRLGI